MQRHVVRSSSSDNNNNNNSNHNTRRTVAVTWEWRLLAILILYCIALLIFPEFNTSRGGRPPRHEDEERAASTAMNDADWRTITQSSTASNITNSSLSSGTITTTMTEKKESMILQKSPSSNNLLLVAAAANRSASISLSHPSIMSTNRSNITTTTTTGSTTTIWKAIPLVHSDDAVYGNHSSSDDTNIIVMTNMSFQVQGPCSCLNPRHNFICCQRILLVVHKMGSTAAQELVRYHLTPWQQQQSSPFPIVTTAEIMYHHPHGRTWQRDLQRPFTNDYRHVVLTRDWYDSLVSGYLYHKSGKECWRDGYGRPLAAGLIVEWLLNNTREDWERRLIRYYNQTGVPTTTTATATSTVTTSSRTIATTTTTTTKLWTTYRPWPPGRGRDLCRYLADEPELDGLHVYTAWAWTNHLHALWNFRRTRLAWEQQQGWNRTRFLCYEDVVTPSNYNETVHDLQEWFLLVVPQQQPLHLPNGTKEREQPRQQGQAGMRYDGGHASTRNDTLRRRLRAMVAQLDEDLYDGALARASREFGCQPSMTMK